MRQRRSHSIEFKRQVAQAKANGTDIIRDVPVEIRCMHEGHVEATFLVWWPRGHAEMHVLMPREYVRGRA